MKFRIKSLTVGLFETTSKDPTSLHPGYDTQTFVITRIETEDGILGFGEAPATPFITGETIETMLAVLRGQIAPAVKGMDIQDIAGLHRKLKSLFTEGNRSAFSAVDMAVYGALGHSLGVPISVLLGGKHAGPIETSRAISTDSSDKMAAAARRNREAGYRTIKIKTGSNAKAELDAIRVIRKENPDLRLKLDANQGWKFTEALCFLDQAAKYDIYAVDQPLDAHDFKGSAELRRRISIPVMLDESIHDPADALRAVSEGAADYINIKLLKTGGLYHAAQIAVIAAAAGIGCQIGTLSTLARVGRRCSSGPRAPGYWAAGSRLAGSAAGESGRRFYRQGRLCRPAQQAGIGPRREQRHRGRYRICMSSDGVTAKHAVQQVMTSTQSKALSERKANALENSFCRRLARNRYGVRWRDNVFICANSCLCARL